MVKIGKIKGSDDPDRSRRIRGKGSRLPFSSGDYGREAPGRPYSSLSVLELKDRISSSGRNLVSSPSREGLTLYQELISEAIERAVRGGLSIHREKAFHPEPKVFTIIATVNAHLLDLAEEIRRSQVDTIRLANIVEEIKGLVADLIG